MDELERETFNKSVEDFICGVREYLGEPVPTLSFSGHNAHEFRLLMNQLLSWYLKCAREYVRRLNQSGGR